MLLCINQLQKVRGDTKEMNKKLITLGFVAAASLALAGCETANTGTTANKASANANTATVVNSSAVNSNSVSPISTTNTTTVNTNAGTMKSNINYNGTAKDNESQRSSIEAEAKTAGAKIGTGAEDWWIWSKTQAAFKTSTTLKDSTGINVDVNNSMITLRGTVPTEADVKEADKIAKGISGQKGVQNQLKPGSGGAASETNKVPAKKG
jgi:osmotically-inducible protein OsmY